MMKRDETAKSLKLMENDCKSWIAGTTTSTCESINATIAKCNMDKRIDFCGRGSYERRVKVAVLQRARGQRCLLGIFPLLGVTLTKKTLSYIELCDKDTENRRKKRVDCKPKPKRNKKGKPAKKRDTNYGNVLNSREEVLSKMAETKAKLILTNEEIADLAAATRTRLVNRNEIGVRVKDNHLLQLLKNEGKKEELIQKVVYHKENVSLNGTWQLLKPKLEKKFGEIKSGLFIDEKHNFFCCQPDGDIIFQGERTIINFCDGGTGLTFKDNMLQPTKNGNIDNKIQKNHK
jgi:hypothetical protein